MSGSKINVAKQAIEFLHRKLSSEMILGIGTGTTVNFFIEELKAYKHLFKGAVSSSERSTVLLKEAGIIVYDLNDIREIAFYIDGADEVADDKSLIKGGGGAHTREKLLHQHPTILFVLWMNQNLLNSLVNFLCLLRSYLKAEA